MKLNLPTKLTVLRLLLIPFCMAAIIAPVFPGDVIWRIVAVAIFALTSITDMLDGMIARKYNLVTTLGKFLDPLADKMLIIGVLISVMLRYSGTRPSAPFSELRSSLSFCAKCRSRCCA